ncbi:hypothetical protein [Bacillus sp. JJ1764]|uniref:hypothetical protein n=1 Tax=Bacillus sp. JJ1764 TaxID=3122964 RepID=UPI002FFE3FB8
MKYKQPIGILTLFISLFSILTTSVGIFSNQGPGEYKFQSIYGETISIYGKGLYQHDSASMALQAIAQDYVTLFLGVPLLLISLYFSKKDFLKGRLILTGTLGYFLYTYVSYSFLSMYNRFFLVYVLLMSLSFFAFTLSIMSFNIPRLPEYFHEKLPRGLIGAVLIFVSTAFGILWMGKIAPSLSNGNPPVGIEHYTTMVIQALDLGFIIPIGLLAGILLIKRKPFGYLLASIITIKLITLLTALTAMILLQILAGIKVGLPMLIITLFFNIIVIYCLYLIMVNIREKVTGTIGGQMSV